MTPTQSFPSVAKFAHRRYGAPVAAKSATGFGDPMNSRRTGAPITITGAFFVPAHPVYGGCAWETFGSAGFLDSRFANLRTAATRNRLATISGSSSNLGAVTMQFSRTQNPSAASGKAAAHRAMAIAALHADSSLSVRLRRWNHHMTIARTLEAIGGAA